MTISIMVRSRTHLRAAQGFKRYCFATDESREQLICEDTTGLPYHCHSDHFSGQKEDEKKNGGWANLCKLERSHHLARQFACPATRPQISN